MHPILFEIGSIQIPSQPALFFCGLLLGLVVLLHHGYRLGTHWKILVDSFMAVAIGGVLFARLYVLLLDPSWFQEHPQQIFRFSVYGLHLYGSVVGALLAAVVVSVWHGYEYLRLTDLIALVAPLALALAGLGSFLQGSAFGELTTMNLGVVTTHSAALSPLNFPRHPTALYLALLMLLLYGGFLLALPRKMFHGYFTALFLISMPLLREIISPLTIDRYAPALWGLHLGPVIMTLERLTSLLLMAAGIVLFWQQKSQRLI